MGQLLDNSVASNAVHDQGDGYVIHQGKVIDLSKIDVDQLREEIKITPYKAVEIDDLETFIEEALRQMINRNCERIKFSDRFKGIIDRYNAGGSENEDYYEQLLRLVEDMKKENERPNEMGLTEEELEIFDLLAKGKKLTKTEEQKVILSAKDLFQRLNANRSNLFVADWYKDEQPKAKVKDAIMEALDADLP